MAESPITGALVDLARAKSYMQRAGTTVDDDRLAEFLNYVTGQAESYTKRRLLSRTYVGSTALVHDGTGCDEIRVLEYPVTSVTAIRRRLTGATTEALNITGLRLRYGRFIWLENDRFTSGDANIEIDCIAGYIQASHESEIKALQGAALRWIQVLYQDYQEGLGRGVTVNVGTGSISMIDAEMPKDVKGVFDQFKRFP